MPGDADLIQIVDSALAEAARKAGPWLACRPGCAQCCLGPFAVTQLDAERLRAGLAALEISDPARAARIRARAADAVAALERDYPGDTLTRVLDEDDAAADQPCPVLDPVALTCDLYAERPIVCRTFGPPVRFGAESLAVCELCFDGATDSEIAACEVQIDSADLEARLSNDLEAATGRRGDTIVAYALACSSQGVIGREILAAPEAARGPLFRGAGPEGVRRTQAQRQQHGGAQVETSGRDVWLA